MLTDEGLVGDAWAVADLLGEMVGEAAGELEDGGFGDFGAGQRGVAAPADLDAGEEIGFRAGELVDPDRDERSIGAENLRVRRERGGGAAAVGGRADLLELRSREAPGEALAVKLLLTRDFDDGFSRKSVDHADANAVESAGRGVGFSLEFSPGVERGHDHFERRLARIFRVSVHRDSAAVVGDRQAIAGAELDLDTAGVAGDRFVHAVVDDLGGEVVERARVGPADVHAGAPADRLEPLQHLDRRRVVALGGGWS